MSQTSGEARSRTWLSRAASLSNSRPHTAHRSAGAPRVAAWRAAGWPAAQAHGPLQQPLSHSHLTHHSHQANVHFQQQLAEEALQDAVERLEEHIGHMMELMEVPVAESTQVELSLDLGWLTAVVIYESAEVTRELVRVREFSVDVQDEDINHQMVTKSVRLDVVRRRFD